MSWINRRYWIMTQEEVDFNDIVRETSKVVPTTIKQEEKVKVV